MDASNDIFVHMRVYPLEKGGDIHHGNWNFSDVSIRPWRFKNAISPNVYAGSDVLTLISGVRLAVRRGKVRNAPVQYPGNTPRLAPTCINLRQLAEKEFICCRKCKAPVPGPKADACAPWTGEKIFLGSIPLEAYDGPSSLKHRSYCPGTPCKSGTVAPLWRDTNSHHATGVPQVRNTGKAGARFRPEVRISV